MWGDASTHDLTSYGFQWPNEAQLRNLPEDVYLNHLSLQATEKNKLSSVVGKLSDNTIS